MQPKKKCSIFVCLCGTSIFLIASGITLLCVWDLLYNYIVSSSLVLAPNSTAYNLWIRNPIPLDLKLYVFNWTNPEEINNRNSKPKFVQMGPYTYLETKEKSSIVWNENKTVTFRHLKKWWFDARTSNGSLQDPLTTVNPIGLSAAYTARYWNYLVKKSMGAMLSEVHITRPVGQVLFDGYEDSMMNFANKVPFLTEGHFPPMDKFGWFYGRNGSEDFEGTFNMGTGVSGRSLGELYNWKYANHTPYYPGTCGEFANASAGEFFPVNLKKSSIIKFFSSDLCRYVELEFEKEEIVNGIIGYKYSASDKFLDNGTKIRENRCFCQGDCMPYGVLNVSACRYGSPAFVSLPHFYKADPYYLQDIDGVSPDAEKHDFFMTFEPLTGVPLKVAARLQLNLQLQSISGMTLYSSVPTVYFPILWFEQVVLLPDSMAFNLKLLINFKVICWAISIILISVGVLIDICLFYKICTTNVFGKKKHRKIPKEEVPLKENTEKK